MMLQFLDEHFVYIRNYRIPSYHNVTRPDGRLENTPLLLSHVLALEICSPQMLRDSDSTAVANAQE